MPFQRYMQQALYAPGLGYYVNGLHKFGAAGDFVTAPEIGELFARGVAIQLDAVPETLDGDWTLMEAGPGSGALARALLPALRRPPERYLLLEPSAVLRQVQAETLADLPASLRDRIEWIDQPPEQPFEGAVLANEVMDALPVARFRITPQGPRALAVDVSEAADGLRFDWVETEPDTRLENALASLTDSLREPLAPGFESEICLDLPGWLDTVTRPLAGGMALLVDYGYPRTEYYHPDRSAGTLVCHYRHRAHFDPFVWPGLTDLSAFVDFTASAEAGEAAGLNVAGFTTQAGFLIGAGVHHAIEEATDNKTRMRLIAEFKQLMLPGEMGEKFKLLALTRNCEPVLEAFEEHDQLRRL